MIGKPWKKELKKVSDSELLEVLYEIVMAMREILKEIGKFDKGLINKLLIVTSEIKWRQLPSKLRNRIETITSYLK